MLIEEMMVTKVFTLKRHQTIKDAAQLIQDKNIRHIPIVDEDFNCIGIVTDRDIRSAIPSIFYSEEQAEVFTRPVESIMTSDVITAHPLDFVEEIASQFYKYQIGCLPVLKNNQLVGIVTETDVLKTFVKLTGTDQPGSQIEVKVPNKPGQLSSIIQLISQKKLNILSVLIYPDEKDHASKIVVLRISTINPTPIVSILKDHQYEILWPSIPEYQS